MAMSSHIRCCSRVGVGVVHVFSINCGQKLEGISISKSYYYLNAQLGF